mgnify:CR=1 FL=1
MMIPGGSLAEGTAKNRTGLGMASRVEVYTLSTTEHIMPTVMPDRATPQRDDYPQELFDADRGVALRLSYTGDTFLLSLALFLDDNNGEEIEGPESLGAIVRALQVGESFEDDRARRSRGAP